MNLLANSTADLPVPQPKSPNFTPLLSFSFMSGTVGLPFKKVEELCFNAGFENVKEIDINHPINSLFQIS